MRKSLYLILLVCCRIFIGCSTAEKISPEVLMYGDKDTISVGFTYHSIVQESINVKSTVTVNETAVNNINIYVFNELGDIISHKYICSGESVSDLFIYKNMKYRVYAIANASESIPKRTLSELEGLTKRIDNISQIVDASSGVLMSGKTDLQTLTHGQIIPVNLVRCVCKFILKCDYTQLSSNVTVTVKRVGLKNAPAEILLFGNSKAVDGKVIDAEERTGSDLAPLSTDGAAFYLFENLQGQVAPSALNNKQKEGSMSAQAKANSSYIEMEYDYLSDTKKGTIVYRFYLGKGFADCDVKRNNQYTCTVLFKGDGSADENSWSVDNSGLIDRVTGIILNPASHKFTALGAVLPLQAIISPVTANNKVLAWSSSNPAVAAVDAIGNVTSVGDGSCIITATSTDGTNISATCTIEVNSKIYVSSVSVSPTTLTVFVSQTEQLTATVLPANATVNTVTWSSSNTAIATVDQSGKITAISPGSADITVTSNDDNSKKAVCKITVQSKELTINPLSKTLYIGETFAISYTVNPVVLPKFISSNSGVASVDINGNVTAVGVGSAKIVVEVHGLSAECSVTVVKPEIAFPSSGRIMYDGEIVTVPYAKLVPSTSAPVVSVNNSNVEILEVTTTGIKIKANSVGAATITATVGGVSATYNVDVQLLRIVFNGSAPLKFYQGYNDPVAYTIYPDHARSLTLLWSSSNESNLTKISDNIFRGKAANTSATITAQFIDFPAKTFSINANIRPAFTIDETNIDLLANCGLSSLNSPQYKNIYLNYSLTIDKHPRAVIQWSGDKIGNDKETVHVSANGVLSTPKGTSVNGTTSLMGTLTNPDDGGNYTDNLSIRVYEAVNVTFVYHENVREALPDGDVTIEGLASGSADKPIGYFNGSYRFSITELYSVEWTDNLGSNEYVTSFVESPYYPPVGGQECTFDIEEKDRRDENGAVMNDEKYRYYLSYK